MAVRQRLVLAFAILVAAVAPTGARTRGIPLQYDAALAADGFPSPLVWLTVGGHRVAFLIDTGAGVHALARWFVTAAALPAKPTHLTVLGSTGQESAVEVVAQVAGTLDNRQPVSLTDAIVADFPPLFEQHRIGGLISPQLLAAAGEDAVLDLSKPRLTFRSARRSRTDAASHDRVCTNADSPFRNRLYGAPVVLDGRPATLLIDTGATRTHASTASPVGRDLLARSVVGGEVHGVGGAAEATRRVPSVRIERGGTTAIADVVLSAATNTCGPDGLLGMDALARCELVLGESRIAMNCRR